jgi:hypothetical protein
VLGPDELLGKDGLNRRRIARDLVVAERKGGLGDVEQESGVVALDVVADLERRETRRDIPAQCAIDEVLLIKDDSGGEDERGMVVRSGAVVEVEVIRSDDDAECVPRHGRETLDDLVVVTVGRPHVAVGETPLLDDEEGAHAIKGAGRERGRRGARARLVVDFGVHDLVVPPVDLEELGPCIDDARVGPAGDGFLDEPNVVVEHAADLLLQEGRGGLRIGGADLVVIGALALVVGRRGVGHGEMGANSNSRLASRYLNMDHKSDDRRRDDER